MPKRVCCAAALSAWAIAANAQPAAIERSFEVSPGGMLRIAASEATVAVRGGSDQVRIAVSRGEDDAAAIQADFDIAFEQEGDDVLLRIERRGLGWRTQRRRLEIAVQTPRDYRADVATSGGSVTVEGLNGAVAAKTAGGSLRLAALAGSVTGRTAGGAIRHAGTSASVDFATSGGAIGIGEVRGRVQAKTTGGRIVVARADGPVRARTTGGSIEIGAAGDTVDAQTTGGSIDAAFVAQPSGPSRLATTGGSIHVRLPAAVGVDIHAVATGGQVRIRDALALQGEVARRSAAGRINGGGPALKMRTTGGSIVLAPL